MPSKSPETALRDILHHIDLAADFAAGLDYERFRHDVHVWHTFTRDLQPLRLVVLEELRNLGESP